MFQVFGLLLGMAVLIYLAYKSWGMLPATIIAGLVVIITNRMDLWEALSVNYANALKGFVGTYLLMFFFGAAFGNLMGESGAAKSISLKLMKLLGKDKAMLIIIIAAAVLSYGGISLFVCVFALYPIGLILFKEANISKKLFPACMLFGCATFTMVAVPGTPAISNIIPTTYLGTTAYAAPVLGIVTSIVMFILGYAYLNWEKKRLEKKGEFFVPGPKDNMESLVIDEENLPDWKTSLVPMIIVMGTIFGLKNYVSSMYSVVIALVLGVISTLIIFRKYLAEPLKIVNKSAESSILAILNTAAIVGFGGIVQGSAGFQTIVDFALGLNISPLVSTGIAVNAVAGITASSSGGLTVFMDALGQQYLEITQAAGIPADVLHRIASISSAGLDSLPHSGATYTCILVSGLTHKDAYKYVFGTNCICTILALVVAIALASTGLILF